MKQSTFIGLVLLGLLVFALAGKYAIVHGADSGPIIMEVYLLLSTISLLLVVYLINKQ